jgi:hypothetical protein
LRATKEAHKQLTTGTPRIPAFPARCFKAYSALSSVRRAFWPPSPASVTCRLDISVGISGPHGFAVRPRVTRHATQAAAIAFHPAFVAIAIRPSLEWNRRIMIFDLGRRQALF